MGEVVFPSSNVGVSVFWLSAIDGAAVGCGTGAAEGGGTGAAVGDFVLSALFSVGAAVGVHVVVVGVNVIVGSGVGVGANETVGSCVGARVFVCV